MSPGVTAIVWAAASLGVLLAVALVVDHFFGPLPVIRKARKGIGVGVGALLVVVSFGLLRRPKRESDATTHAVPKEFDDAPEQQLKKDAANLDLDVVEAARQAGDAVVVVVDLGARADARDELLKELGGADTSDPV